MSITRIAAFFLLATSFCLWHLLTRADSNKLLSTPEQIQEDILSLDCRRNERLPAVQALFEKMGASASEISLERFKQGENLVVRKPGKSQEIIVVGAHYDRTAVGCGAVDNWSGVVAMAHIYQTVRQTLTNKSIIFVAFGKEEAGRLGSKAMTDSIEKSQRRQYCAMINLDSLGMGPPQVIESISSKKLTSRVTDLAAQIHVPFAKQPLYGPDSDSSSFREKGIPAITIHGLSGEISELIHTANDQPASVKPERVHLAYRLALALVANIDDCKCDEFR
jgi:Zn-dependent M28 family amino/carboxypeptidase